jgi:asparagine synthase (glutamine-hydrolysing)
LVKVDRASMHYSLETRVPLLDYRIVEFAMSLGYGLKDHKGSTKYLLKKVLYSYLPEKLFDRPKWGFAIPLRKWLKGPLKNWMMDSLSEDVLRKHTLVDPPEVNKLIRKYLETDSEYLYNRIWALVVLHNFLEKNK